ncbi:MAG: hypothetical protein ACE5IR_02760 [bacterium]
MTTQSSHTVKAGSTVENIFRELNSAKIDYCLLRGFEELFTTTGFLEIDLLVKTDHLQQFSRVVAQLGFAPLPSWGHAPHSFFVAFDKERSDWIKLDVVTALSYGTPVRRFRFHVLEKCLQQKLNSQDIARLAPEHEFITLLLHCLLDKETIRQAHRNRLRELLTIISTDKRKRKRMPKLIRSSFFSIYNWDEICIVIEQEDWQVFLDKRSALRRRFFLQQPFSSLYRDVSARLVRRLRPVFFALRRRGDAVALLAPDGAGKSTLAGELVKDRMLKARLVYMGGNIAARNIGLPTTRWLHRRVKALNGKASRSPVGMLWKGLNFGNKLLEQWFRSCTAHYYLLRGRTVIFDRYIYDSWVHKKKNGLLKRIRRFLFEAGLPKPGLVIFLDAPGEVLFRRKGEHTPEWLEQQRQSYLSLRERIPNMKIVDADRPSDSVKSEAIAAIWEHHGRRLNQKGPWKLS